MLLCSFVHSFIHSFDEHFLNLILGQTLRVCNADKNNEHSQWVDEKDAFTNLRTLRDGPLSLRVVVSMVPKIPLGPLLKNGFSPRPPQVLPLG